MLLETLVTCSDTATDKMVAVVSERFWLGRLGGSRNILGQPLLLHGRSFVVMAVAPRRVQFPGSPDVWIPSGIDSEPGGVRAHYQLVVRLREGVRPAEAREELARIAPVRMPLIPDLPATVRITPLTQGLTAAWRPVIVLMVASCSYERCSEGSQA